MNTILAQLTVILLAILFLPVHAAGYLYDVIARSFDAGRKRSNDHMESLVWKARGW